MLSRVASLNWAHTGLTSLAMVIFFSLFALMLAWVFQAASRKSYESASHLPLQADDDNRMIGGKKS